MSGRIPLPDETGTLPGEAPSTARGWGAIKRYALPGVTQLLILLLAGALFWSWLDNRHSIDDMQRQLAEKLAEISSSGKTGQQLAVQGQEQMRELSARLERLEARYTEAQSQRASLEALYDDLTASRDENALAEVEQLLLIAGQQLQLSANAKAALIAMQGADARLQRMNRPALDALRKAIAQDVEKLRALPAVDVADVSRQLNNLIVLVDELPLVSRQRVADASTVVVAPPSDEPFWRKLLRELWQEARQLVRIENTGKADIPLLPPGQEFFLRENLKLRLLSARLALLSRDEHSFRLEVGMAGQWVGRYFDDQSANGSKMLVELKRLSAYPIGVDLPDIGASLVAVSKYRQMHELAAERRQSQKSAR